MSFLTWYKGTAKPAVASLLRLNGLIGTKTAPTSNPVFFAWESSPGGGNDYTHEIMIMVSCYELFRNDSAYLSDTIYIRLFYTKSFKSETGRKTFSRELDQRAITPLTFMTSLGRWNQSEKGRNRAHSGKLLVDTKNTPQENVWR